MTSVKELAYAKINLHLDVLDKRDDGFHSVRTVMQTVSLADEITVSVKPSKKREITMSVLGSKLPVDSRNLAYRAAALFLDSTLIEASVDIRLTKRIPVAAGLAGGSADAAATLRALNRIFKKPLTEKRLLALASELGSDVPFCLIGGTALCLGRGEIIERLPYCMSLDNLVIAIADEHVSTPTAYSRLDELYDDFKGERDGEAQMAFDSLLASVNDGKLNVNNLYNIFENAVLPICSGAERIKQRMTELGAAHALMSGSGPSVFGIFTDASGAENAARALVEEGCRAFVARSV